MMRQLGVDTGYVLLGFPLAVVSFSVIVTGLSAGVGLLVVFVGVPVLVGSVFIARVFADIERFRYPAVLRQPRTRPAYRKAAPDAGWWRRLVTPLGDGQSWLDLAHAVARFPIAVATFVIMISWWAVAIAGTLTIAWDWAIPRGPDNTSLAQLVGLGDSTAARIGFQTAIGLLCLITLPFIVRACALLEAGFARILLTGVAELRQTITVLTEQKSAAASAEAHALRRLERDIHDGPSSASSGWRWISAGPGRAANRVRCATLSTRRSPRPRRPSMSCARCPAVSHHPCSPTAAYRVRLPHWPSGALCRLSWPSIPSSARRWAGSIQRWRPPCILRSPRH